MTSNLLFDFVVYKGNNTINIKKEFDADLSLIWDVYTKSELLDQWWAPKPWTNKTKSMDFREGGMWHYSMVSPEGQTNWCRLDYITIETKNSYSALDAFCDEEGKLNEEFPRTKWKLKFVETDNKTGSDIKCML
jgi:PhnB protein